MARHDRRFSGTYLRLKERAFSLLRLGFWLISGPYEVKLVEGWIKLGSCLSMTIFIPDIFAFVIGPIYFGRM